MASILDKVHQIDMFDVMAFLHYYKEHYNGEIEVVIQSLPDASGHAMLRVHYSHHCGHSEHYRHYDTLSAPMDERAVSRLPEVVTDLLYTALARTDGCCVQCQAVGKTLYKAA